MDRAAAALPPTSAPAGTETRLRGSLVPAGYWGLAAAPRQERARGGHALTRGGEQPRGGPGPAPAAPAAVAGLGSSLLPRGFPGGQAPLELGGLDQPPARLEQAGEA